MHFLGHPCDRETAPLYEILDDGIEGKHFLVVVVVAYIGICFEHDIVRCQQWCQYPCQATGVGSGWRMQLILTNTQGNPCTRVNKDGPHDFRP